MLLFGILVSYNYFFYYDDEIECIWWFDVDFDYKIELIFDIFNLFFFIGCIVDFVEIDSVRYCGLEKFVFIILDGSDMCIKFKLSGKIKYLGF